MRFKILLALILVIFYGCSLFKKKSFEDSEQYKELMKYQENLDKKLDSIRQENFKMLNDSTMQELRRKNDSLKQRIDSLGKEIEKSFREFKKSTK
jgi:hypothetical protein